MAGIKYEEKIYFPEGNIYVLLDDEWGVSVTGEDGIGGELVGMISWQLNTRESWLEWGKTVVAYIQGVKTKLDSGLITSSKAIDLIYDIENNLTENI